MKLWSRLWYGHRIGGIGIAAFVGMLALAYSYDWRVGSFVFCYVWWRSECRRVSNPSPRLERTYTIEVSEKRRQR